MPEAPWQGDACSLVDAFRAGERTPVDELETTLAAIEASDLNAFAHIDPERARRAAAAADVSKPFGGVPTGIKQLDPVAGWPFTEASLVFRDRVANYTAVAIERLFTKGGVTPVGQTTASEFGGLNVSVTKINGVTHNPWRHGRTVGGSSSGSSAAVAGGLITLASGGDGGGSIRIPAGYTGLLGMKGTFGRIPRSPNAYTKPNTVVFGSLVRSVRDAARYFDVCSGPHAGDPSSLPAHDSFEAGLGTHDLAGLKVAVLPSIGDVPLDPGVEAHLLDEAEALIADTGMKRVDLDLALPNLAAYWASENLITLLADLGDLWPRCASELTDEIAIGLMMSEALYNLRAAAEAERLRIQADEALGSAFGEVDLIICSTNPGPAFAANATTSNPEPPIMEWAKSSRGTRLAMRAGFAAVRAASAVAPGLPTFILDQGTRRMPDLVTMGGLTIPANIYGNPAVSIPAGTIDGLPVGMQVMAPHHADALLFDVALAVERNRPWPLVARAT